MPYASVLDIAASWQHYQRLAAPLLAPPPAGLILHLAGPTDEGIRIIDIWESPQAWQQFHSHRLQPALAALDAPLRPELTFRDLHTAHLIGATDATAKR